MKKVLLLMATLFTMGVNSWAGDKVYADLSKYAAWDGTNVSLTWTATWGNQLNPALDLPTGDLRSYEKLVIEVSEINNADFFRILVYNGSNSDFSNTFKVTKTGIEDGNGKMEFTLKGNVNNLDNVTAIKLSGSNGEDSKAGSWGETPASFKVKAVYLEKPDISYIEVSKVYDAGSPAGTTDLDNMKGADGNAWNISYPQSVANETLFGGNIDADNLSINIEDYDYLHFVVSNASSDAKTGLRVFVSTASSDDNSTRACLYPRPAESFTEETEWTATSWITSPGVYVVKVSEYPLLRGFKALQNWAGNAGTISVSEIYLTKGSPVLPNAKYSLVGEVLSDAVTDVLNDPTATLIDATGVTGTDVDLSPGEEGNPNCIFLANEGALANAQNVCVDGNIENLFITDGYPVAAELFNGETTYNFASFFREEPKKIGTLCLPFGVSAKDLDHMKDLFKFYTVSGIDAENAITLTRLTEITAGVPCIVEKLDDVDLMLGSFMDSPETLKPATPQSATVGSYEVEVIGSYKQETIAATGASKPPFYYGLSDGEMVQALESITVNPFRAYVKLSIPKAAPARLTFAFAEDSEEATAIKNLAGQGKAKMVGIYSVNGAQQKSLQQGMNVVKFSDGTSQKVLVK